LGVVRWFPLDAQRPMMGIEGKAAGYGMTGGFAV
jgi:hypothetical protein